MSLSSSQDNPPEEIQKPLKSTNLVERFPQRHHATEQSKKPAHNLRCGVSEWDNEYVNIEQEVTMMFAILVKLRCI